MFEAYNKLMISSWFAFIQISLLSESISLNPIFASPKHLQFVVVPMVSNCGLSFIHIFVTIPDNRHPFRSANRWLADG
jgi:hypothetical protein